MNFFSSVILVLLKKNLVLHLFKNILNEVDKKKILVAIG